MGSKLDINRILLTAAMLALFAMLGTGLVALSYTGTRARVDANERATLLKRLDTLLPDGSFDNDVVKDTIQVRDPGLLGTKQSITVYRARMQGRPTAAILTPVAPDGYSGEIKLLVGIHYDGTLTGVRVLEHHETPGLGDPIEEDRSDWITRFTGHSLSNPAASGWKVKRDGGDFDQFTGATITPRAVVNAVHKCLLYFAQHRAQLFASPSP
jgi:Na+-translocating ferredoxin:NAD+ oxidoreductase subunit G